MPNKQFNIKINRKIYGDELLWPVIDILSNEYTIQVDRDKTHYLLEITPKYQLKQSKKSINNLVFDHLNNQKIRSQIIKKFSRIREMIVGKALFSTEAFDDNSNIDLDNYSPEDNYILDIKEVGKTYEEKNEK